MSNEQEQVNASTFEAALGFAKQLRAQGINWDELGDIAGMVGKIQSALNGRQDTNLLDVEDVLQEVVINVSLYNMRRDFGQAFGKANVFGSVTFKQDDSGALPQVPVPPS